MGNVFFAQNCAWSEIREIGTFLATLPWGPFFDLVLFWLVAEMSTRWTHAKCYKTRGFRPISRLSASSTPLVLFKASILRTKFDDNFFCVLLFSTFRSSKFWRNWVFRFKNALGLQSQGRFEKRFFCVVSGARANLTRGERAGAIIFCLVWRRSQKWPRRCGAEGFPVFFGFFLATLFRKLQMVLCTPPSFCLGVFLFCSPSSWDWGQRRIASVFLGSWPSTFLFFWVFFGSFYKTLFSPEKGLFWFISRCLPFVLLGFFHFSLSLSLSLFFFLVFFCPLPCCLVFIFTFLVFWLFFVVLFLRFCFMKRTTSKYYICTFDFHKSFLCFLIRLSQICSYLCFFFIIQVICLVHINVFQVLQEDHFGNLNFGFALCERLSFF